MNTSGYLFNQQIRYNFVIFGSVGLLGLLFCDGFIWYLFHISQQQDMTLFFTLALLFTFILLYYCLSGLLNFQIIFMTYRLDDFATLTRPDGKKYTLSLSEPYRMDRIKIRLYQGKGSQDCQFYILSTLHAKQSILVDDGTRSVLRLLRNGAILLPTDQSIYSRISKTAPK